MKVIVIINGRPRAGKDAFVRAVRAAAEMREWTVINWSSIDPVKRAAAKIGWDGVKDARGRKLLSGLKALLGEYCDFSYEKTREAMKSFLAMHGDGMMFIHIREPEEIARAVSLAEALGAEARTLLVTSPRAEGDASNSSDAGVEGCRCDASVYNGGTLEDLARTAEEFFSDWASGARGGSYGGSAA